LDHYLELKEQIKTLQEIARQTENELKNELKDAEIGIVKNYQVNWKPVTQNRVDTKVLKEKYPNIYQEVLKNTTYRKFSVKELT